MTATQTWNVPDMSCQHCIDAITGEVGKVAGVSAVAIDLDGKTVSVEGGDAAAIVASAVVVGLAYGPMTPASSVALSRWAPANRLGLIMSIKQTGVPIAYELDDNLQPQSREFLGDPEAVASAAAAVAAQGKSE